MSTIVDENIKMKRINKRKKEVAPSKNTTYMELAYILKEAGVDIDIEECKKVDQIDQVYESEEK